MHSDPRQAVTDAQGEALFSSVAPGKHTVSFEYEGKTVSKPIEVADKLSLSTLDVPFDTPVSEPQVFTINASISGAMLSLKVFAWTSIILAILVAAYLLIKRYSPRLTFGNSQSSNQLDTNITSGNINQDGMHEINHTENNMIDKVQGLPSAQPGATITPRVEPDKHDENQL